MTRATALVLNGSAGSASRAEAEVRALAEARAWRVLETSCPGDGERQGRRAAQDGARRVVAAGGDGTVSEVARGLLGSASEAELVVLPLGTGNDLARTLGMPLDIEAACRWLAGEPESDGSRADVIEVQGSERTWAINSVNGGIADDIRDRLDAERKARWGPLAFPLAALEALGELTPWAVRLEIDGAPPVDLPATFTVLAANGSTVGGGFEVAPGASIASGKMEVVVVRGENLVDLLRAGLRTKMGQPEASDLVHRHRCTRLRIEAPEDFRLSVDGEPFEGADATLHLRPQALAYLPGPGT